MSLILRQATPPEGVRWVRDAFRLYARRPIGFTAMFAGFLVIALLLSVVPLVGAVLLLMSLPLLGLGFLIASRSALSGGAVHPAAFLEALRGAPARRNALLTLCALYAIATALVLQLSDWIDGGTFARLQTLMAQGEAAQAEVEALLADPRLGWGLIVRFGLAAALAVPFWQAPALVHWQGQSVGQALFSSTLALWRCKAAFAVYAFAWLAVVLVFGLIAALLFGLIGARQMAGVAALPAALVFSTVFYVSLIYTYDGCFSDTEDGSLPAA